MSNNDKREIVDVESRLPKPQTKVSKVNQALKGLTVKQRKFVKSVAVSGNATTAVLEAGYNTKTNANRMAHTLLKNEGVNASLNQVLDIYYPKLTDDAALILQQIIDDAKSPESTIKDKREALKLMSELRGWNAAKKSTTMKVDAKDFFKLPK